MAPVLATVGLGVPLLFVLLGFMEPADGALGTVTGCILETVDVVVSSVLVELLLLVDADDESAK